MRERRLMQIGKQSIKYPPIIVTKLNPPQTIILDHSASNESSTDQIKILDFKDFPKIKLKGKYKKKETRDLSRFGEGPMLLQSWAADEAAEGGGNSPVI
jgi:hypothetical protein